MLRLVDWEEERKIFAPRSQSPPRGHGVAERFCQQSRRTRFHDVVTLPSPRYLGELCVLGARLSSSSFSLTPAVTRAVFRRRLQRLVRPPLRSASVYVTHALSRTR